MERPKKREVSQWYINVIRNTNIFDYGPVKGTMVLRPYGFAIWKAIQNFLDPEIQKLGCKDAYFPSLIPEGFIVREKEHVEGFSPELALITHAGGEKLEEPVIIRLTSETIMYHFFAKWIKSWRDLPMKINQWVNIVRWEKRNFPFLRGTEFLWHEAHTAHATYEESEKQVWNAINMYKHFFEEILSIPVVIGKKTPREKFAGALYSTSCEAFLIDGKGLQIGTAHNLGQNFSKSFEITYQTKNGNRGFVWQTSWGISTRAIGGLILTHGDERGLILPPKVAPIQIIIVPIWKSIEDQKKVISQTSVILERLKTINIRTEVDLREEKPGWKYYDWEMKGVPIRVEVGPRDIKLKQVVIARRDTGDKITVSLDRLINEVDSILNDIQNNLLKRAQHFVEDNTFEVENYADFSDIIENKSGLIKAYWCGNDECERLIKEKTKATTRCIPFDSGEGKGKCIYCSKKATIRPLWGRAY